MNGSTENTAHGAPEKPGRGPVLLNLATARKMLPLVERIVADVLHSRRSLAPLIPELDQLDGQRRSLTWSGRARRYQLQAEIAALESNLQEALAELQGLNVAVLGIKTGEVGFPTLVNGRQAFFSWRPGEEGIHFWQFPGEEERWPIPGSWVASPGQLAYSKG
jgi:hypothetical protein